MTLGRLALLLPIATQLLLWALVSLHRERLGLGRVSARGTLVMAFVIGQLVLVGITEVLNLWHGLTGVGAAAAWLLVTLVLSVVLVATGGWNDAKAWHRGGGWGRGALRARSSPTILLALVALVLIGATLVYTAWTFLPNNSDSLAYHLTRVAHWSQEHSVDHFATHYRWQIQLAPLHEYDMLHLHLLANTDRLDGFPQLASFVVCVVGAGEVVRLLRGDAEVQVLAAVIAATIPSFVLEATSTQNNLFAAAIGLALVILAMAWQPLQPAVLPALLLGAGIALIVLSKGTAIPLVVPVVVGLGLRILVREVRASSWRAVAPRLLLVGAVAGVSASLVIGPFWSRNLDVLGSVNGDVAHTLNDEVTPQAAVANAVRNLALHLRIGDGESGFDTEVSQALLPVLEQAFDWTGAPSSDGHLDYGREEDAFELRDYREYERNEDYGASPWFTLLLVLCLPVLWVRAIRGDASVRMAALIAGAGVVAFLLFSATTKWTTFGARYALPLMALGPPLLAIVLAGVHRYLLRGVAVVLLVAGLPALVDSWARPLLDRPPETTDLDPYVVARPTGDAPLSQAQNFVDARDAIVAAECDRVGVGTVILFEYLLWVGLDNVDWDGEIQHIGPFANRSGELEDRSFEPCAVVHDAWMAQGATGPDGWPSRVFGSLTVFLSPEGAARAGWDVTPASSGTS